MIKVAVVGFGQMSLLHASLLNVMPGVKLVTLCDKSSLIHRFCKKIFKDIRIVSVQK
jgi:predicted dehydrogenase